MKNNKFLMGMLVILLALGMTVAGCSKGSKADNGGEITESDSGGSGEKAASKTSGGGDAGSGTMFTLTDIPSKYNGKYARITLVGGNVTLTGAQNITKTTVTLPQISGGKVLIPLWEIRNVTSFVRYSGDGSFTLGTVNLYNTGNDNDKDRDAIADIVFMGIAITKGSGTKSWNEALTVLEH